jgi:hypothetical protein
MRLPLLPTRGEGVFSAAPVPGMPPSPRMTLRETGVLSNALSWEKGLRLRYVGSFGAAGKSTGTSVVPWR